MKFRFFNYYCPRGPGGPGGPSGPGGPGGPGGPSGPGDLLTGSWQDAECECLLELLTALTGAVRSC